MLQSIQCRSQGHLAGSHGAVGSASDSRVRVPGLDTRLGHIPSFLLPMPQEGQLSVTGESMCTKYWSKPVQKKCG